MDDARDQPIGPQERNRLLRDIRLPVALAVSGGADSMGMMHLIAGWARTAARAAELSLGVAPVLVLTVDHGLRRDSGDEAAFVAAEAEALGLAHVTLLWDGAKPKSGIQEAAREARYELICGHIGAEDLPHPRQVLLAHHQDDQAETVLMRLARGSGLDGLSAMRPSERRIWLRLGHPVQERTVMVCRPFLDVPGERLRASLAAAGGRFRDDPSNRDTRHERVRVRAAGAARATLGLTATGLATSARRLASARVALRTAQAELARTSVDLHDGAWASIDAEALAHAPADVALRLLGAVIAAFGGQRAPVGLGQLEVLLDRLKQPHGQTLGLTLAGAVIARKPGRSHSAGGGTGGMVAVYREPGRRPLPSITLRPGQGVFWDRRFYVSLDGGFNGALQLGPLGVADFTHLKRRHRGLARLKIPADAAATLPALREGADIVAVGYLGREEPALGGPADGRKALLAMQFAPRHVAAVFATEA